MRARTHAVLAAGLLLLAGSAAAQRPGRVRPLTATPALKRVFESVVAAANACTARVHVGDRQVALATVVGADGYLVTKASELRADERREGVPREGVSQEGEPQEGEGAGGAARGVEPGTGEARGAATPVEVWCELDGRRYAAQRVGQDEVADLALLRIERQDLAIADWSESPPRAGAFVATPDGGEAPCGIGILSAPPYQHSRQRGYLGVQLDREPGPARLQTVQPDSAAEAAGLEPDDVILAFGDDDVSTSEQLIAAIGKHAPGSLVQLRVRRGDDELGFEVRLRADRRGPRNNQERIWGPLSAVRAGFATVLQHDTILEPEQCGGPLVDLDGKVVGVNIARAGRVETLALPAGTVREIVERLRGAAARDKW